MYASNKRTATENVRCQCLIAYEKKNQKNLRGGGNNSPLPSWNVRGLNRIFRFLKNCPLQNDVILLNNNNNNNNNNSNKLIFISMFAPLLNGYMVIESK